MISSEQFHEICTRALDGLTVPLELTWVDAYICEVSVGEMSVVVAYDHARSWELTLSLRQHGQLDPAFEVADVLRVTSCPPHEAEKFSLMQSGEPAVVERLLHGAYEAVSRYAGEFLRGSKEAFDRARAARSQRAEQFTRQVNDAPVLRAADEAWSRRDMASVAELLGPISAGLRDRDRRRLEYALRAATGEIDQK